MELLISLSGQTSRRTILENIVHEARTIFKPAQVAVTYSKASQAIQWVKVLIEAEHDSTEAFSIGLEREGTVHLKNVAVPKSFRGRGLFTEFMSKVRLMQGLSGKCRVHVAVDVRGWRTLVNRSGFIWSGFEDDAARKKLLATLD